MAPAPKFSVSELGQTAELHQQDLLLGAIAAEVGPSKVLRVMADKSQAGDPNESEDLIGCPWRGADPGRRYQLQSDSTCERRVLRTKTSKTSSPATVQTWDTERWKRVLMAPNVPGMTRRCQLRWF